MTMPQIDWSVFARQLALILVPMVLAKLKVPDTIANALSGSLVDILTALILAGGAFLVGWVVVIGQRLAQPKQKIAAVAALPQVAKVEVKSEALADSIPNPKVVA